MTNFARKVGDKFVDEAATAIAKALFWGGIPVLLGIVVFITGHPEIGIGIAFIGILVFCVLFGVWIGKRSIPAKTPQPNASELETAVSRGDLCVLGAFYGANDIWKDVTDAVSGFVKDGRHSFTVSNTNLVGGNDKDPVPYVKKRLVGALIYKYQVIPIDAPEDVMVEIRK